MIKRERKTQNKEVAKHPNDEPIEAEESEKNGVLPDDIDFRRGLGCGG